MWRFKQNEEEDEGIRMAAAGFTFLATQITTRKTSRDVVGCGQH
jgi:hypothetical protein